MGKYDRAIGAVAAMLVTILSAPNQAQSQEAETENCRVMPNVDDEESAFREKLADCNGVLKPPITGDSEIREPAPDTGKIRIIRPESQNSGKADSDEEAFIGNRGPDQSFSFLEIVESIAGAAKTAEELQEIRGTAVSVIDLSALTIGANAAVIDSSIAEHRRDLKVLREVVAETPALSEALAASGFSSERVIAAHINEAKHATLFVL